MRAEILSYSRSRGLFAGVSLNGSSLRPTTTPNMEVYGRKLTARQIVTGAPVAVRSPAIASSGPCRRLARQRVDQQVEPLTRHSS